MNDPAVIARREKALLGSQQQNRDRQWTPISLIAMSERDLQRIEILSKVIDGRQLREIDRIVQSTLSKRLGRLGASNTLRHGAR